MPLCFVDFVMDKLMLKQKTRKNTQSFGVWELSQSSILDDNISDNDNIKSTGMAQSFLSFAKYVSVA